MASSGKKGKKNKGKTLALTDFLQETPGAAPSLPIRKSALSWADEVEDAYDSYESRPKTNVVLPTAPKASRGLDDYSNKVPQQPPYIAYLTNLPYDVDKDEIADLFRDLKISNMRIPKDDRSSDAPRLRGYGYVEFEDRDSLISALSMPDCVLKNRRIRIDVASSENDRKRGGRMDMGRDRPDRPEVSMGDWRSGPRVAESSESERRNFSRDSFRDGPPERGERSSDWRSSDRPTFNRDSDRDRGFGDRGGRDSDRDRDRGFGDRGGRFERDSRFGPRRDDRNGGFTRGGGRDDLPPEKTEPRTRPKLNLAPRTKPVENPPPAPPPAAAAQEPSSPPPSTAAPPAPAPSGVPAASIFGSARPVDTSARERQIEERLAKQSEKPPRDSSSDGRNRRYFSDRRSPRRESPRRLSPRYRSPRSGSGSRRRSREGRRYSPSSRRDSYDKDYSPDRRRDSPPRRRYSPDRRADSPERRRYSPERRRESPERRRDSPDRRGDSPDRGRYSPDQGRRGRSPVRRGSPRRDDSPRRDSPERRPSPLGRGDSLEKKASPDRASLERGKSPEKKRSSPRRKPSPERKKVSPERRKKSPEKRKNSPDKRKASADRKALPKKNEEKKGGPKTEKLNKEKDKPKQREHERDMPKLKEPEPPNFASSNKFAFLSAEDDSDN